jgi:hypothetical protein
MWKYFIQIFYTFTLMFPQIIKINKIIQ